MNTKRSQLVTKGYLPNKKLTAELDRAMRAVKFAKGFIVTGDKGYSKALAEIDRILEGDG